MTNIDTALAAVAATYADHSRLVASGTASEGAAQSIAYEIEWTIGDAARAGMVIS